MEERLRNYMEELQCSVKDCPQIFDWMFGAVDFSLREGMISSEGAQKLKEEIEEKFEQNQEKHNGQ